MEIDLKELETFEKNLQKKRDINCKKNIHDKNEIDNIDEYLSKLAIDIQEKNKNCSTKNDCSASDANSLLKVSVFDEPKSENQQNAPVPFPVLLYWLMGIIYFVSSVTANANINNCKNYNLVMVI